jgi:hypothetical protein
MLLFSTKAKFNGVSSKFNKAFVEIAYEAILMGNDHLIEFQLIEIVFYHLIEIMLIT